MHVNELLVLTLELGWYWNLLIHMGVTTTTSRIDNPKNGRSGENTRLGIVVVVDVGSTRHTQNLLLLTLLSAAPAPVRWPDQ